VKPSTATQAGFGVALCAAMALSAWSLYWVARHYGQPAYVAAITAAGFDGVAMAASGYALLYIARPMNSWLPRTLVFVMAAASAFLNAQHAVLTGDPRQAVVMYAVPPIAVITLFEIHARLKLNERNPAVLGAGVPAKRTPVSRKQTFRTRGEGKEVARGGVKGKVEMKDVRDWAQGRGYELGSRGPVDKEIVAEFVQAMNGRGT
jgi:hypothetical protein